MYTLEKCWARINDCWRLCVVDLVVSLWLPSDSSYHFTPMSVALFSMYLNFPIHRQQLHRLLAMSPLENSQGTPDPLLVRVKQQLCRKVSELLRFLCARHKQAS